MIVTQKQLEALIKDLDLDLIQRYLDDSYKIRKFILGCETGINDLKNANEETNDPLDFVLNNNLIKEFEKQIEAHKEMKMLLKAEFDKLLSYLKKTNLDENTLNQLDAISNDEYYVVQTNEIVNNENYLVDYSELQKKNAKTKEKMLGKDYKNIKRSR